MGTDKKYILFQCGHGQQTNLSSYGYVYMHTHYGVIHFKQDAHMHAHTRAHTHAYMYAYMHECTYIQICAHAHTHTHIIHVYIHQHMILHETGSELC